ncbi:MAG: hypothetical protein ACREDX_10470 [Aestuariivirga sp.]
MNKKLAWLLAFIAISVIACATTEPHPGHTEEIRALMQNPETAADHEAIAAHYDEDAKLLRGKAEEHKKILKDFLAHPYLYGKMGQYGFQAHCEYLIRLYSEAADSNLEMAKLHRQIGEGTK